MNPLAIALRGKGVLNVLRRGASLAGRYGLTPGRLDRELGRLAALTDAFNCRATLPITTVVLERHPDVIRRYQDRGVEFAIHGYQHVDHSQLPAAAQRAHLAAAQRAFARAGLQLKGFRAPYLRRNADTLQVLRELGLEYDASQAYAWDDVAEPAHNPAYRRVLEFFQARPADRYPVTPHLVGDFVHVPYSLPDDESLVERLRASPSQMRQLWLECFQRSYVRGELFTLGLHPERTSLCAEPLRAVLAEARGRQPGVWMARLDELAAWWRARSRAELTLAQTGPGAFRVAVVGPPGTTVLARALIARAPSAPWLPGYVRVSAAEFDVEAARRPCLGLSPAAPPALADFLRQHGYVVEISPAREAYALYLERATFTAEDQRPVLAEIENHAGPLVRLGRWPDGAASALAVTGDIDALTLWDYGLRLLER